MKLYCKSCNEYVYLTRPSSATQRCPICFGKLSGRKQREVWKELNDERQGRLGPVEDEMGDDKRKRHRPSPFDD